MRRLSRVHLWKQLTRTFPTLCALGLSLLVGMLLSLAVGESPLLFLRTLLVDTLGNVDSIGYVLFNATPLIFTGLGVAIGFRAGLFNIGCEGQLYMGALATAWTALTFTWLPTFLLLPLCIASAMVSGAIWGGIPGWLRVRFGAHEVINTIMMNFIAFGLVDYLVLNHLKPSGEMISQTAQISNGLHLPRLASLVPFLPDSNPLELSFLGAIGVALLFHAFLKRTVWGYRIRMVGLNPEASIRSGISESRTILLSMGLSGAVAALVGAWDVLGYHYRFVSGFNGGWGFLGIAVALLARNHPIGVIPAACFLGLLSKGALDLEFFTSVPREVVLIVEALAILFLAISSRWGLRFARQEGAVSHD